MRITTLHSWKISPKEAIRLQKALADKVRLTGLQQRPKTIAGADIAFDKTTDEAIAAVILYSFPELEEIERRIARSEIPYPYIPGLLSFREAPVLLEAFSKLSRPPDIAIFDGQGIAHPRGLGLASHMGLWLQLPTIGCAKSRLVGDHREPGKRRGCSAPITLRGERIGACLRTRDNVKPIFVSPGHMIDIEGSVETILACHDATRIPKPTKEADRLVGEIARGNRSDGSR